MPLRTLPRVLGFAVAGILCTGTNLSAQIQAGSETQLNLNGSVSAGYSGASSNEGPDSHGLNFGGTGNLSGYFHSPQFLSFDVAPFFNQSRNNANFQSVADSSGVTASANVFGGSQFPGYFNFSKIYNSESTYSLPGAGNYATNGNSETFGVGWAVNLKNLPILSFGYQQGSSDYSLYGTQGESTDNFRTVFGNASYLWHHFQLSGGIRYSNSSSLFPQIEAGEPADRASSDTRTYTFSVSRSIVLDGTTWANFTRTTTDYDSPGLKSSETADVLSGGVTLRPTAKLTAQMTADYNDNLAGSIFQTVTGSGAVAPISIATTPSHSWGVLGSAQYSIVPGLFATGTVTHREQLFLGQTYDSTSLSGTMSYGHNVLGGQLSATANVSYSSYANYNGSMTGFLANVIYIRRFGAWGVSTSFGYTQNAENILIAYTTSGYTYSGSVNRRIGRLTLTGGANGSKSVLTGTNFPSYFAQGYTLGLSGRWLGAGAGYSKSSGAGLLTSGGIVTPPPGVPPPLLTTVLYGATSYSANVGSTPVRGLTINGTYLHSQSNTANGSLSSRNTTEQAYAYLTYRFRKVYFNAGYSRLLQGFSAADTIPTSVNAYYFGVSRWFKAF